MSSNDPIVIVSAVRTPLGRFLGDLSPVTAPQLGAHAIRAALARANLPAERVDEVLMGCVLPAGQGQAPARQAARAAGLPDATGATTVNKVCGSGMKSTMLAHDLIRAGSADIVVAGGMESMSNAPYLLAKARSGYRVGHDRIFDHMMLDGLEDAYEPGRAMGEFGEAAVARYGFSRAEQDAYAVETLTRARNAIESGAFADEIVAVPVPAKGGERIVDTDEHPLKVSPDKIPQLKPAFAADGTITAASASANADGAAALVLTRRSLARARGPADPGRDPRPCHPQPGTGLVHDGADPGDRQAARQGRLDGRRRRPVRDQRGLRRGGDGRRAGPGHRPRPAQREWRRMRARTSYRRNRRAPHRHAAARVAAARAQPRRRGAVHRRRRGDGDRDRTREGLTGHTGGPLPAQSS